MSDEDFEKLVVDALDSLPVVFANKLENVSVTFADEPSSYQLRKSKLSSGVLLFGLYEGIPQTKRGGYAGVLPDKITIFKNSILRVSNTPEEIKAQVSATLIHEIGHHFGLSDDELR